MKGTGLIILLMTAATALISCGKDSVEIRGGENGEIGFATPFTRGSSISGAAGVALEGGFSVWAYKHTGSWTTASDKSILIDTGRVIGNAEGTEWNYGTPKYWPLNKKVSFFAYAPHGCAISDGTGADGIPSITYEVPAAAVSQKDLMIAAPVFDATGPDPVNEVFYHALSRISFSALKSASMVGEVKITAIELRNIRSSGSTKLLIPVSWEVDSPMQKYVISPLNGLLPNIILNTNIAQNMVAANGTMFLMPQELDASAEIIVIFKVGNIELSWSGAIPAPAIWLPGKSYNYKLLVDGEMVVVVCGQLESPVVGPIWGDV